MKAQEPPQEPVVHTGKQVVVRLIAFVAVIIAIIVLYKIVLG
jgi:hypothetical protein